MENCVYQVLYFFTEVFYFIFQLYSNSIQIDFSMIVQVRGQVRTSRSAYANRSICTS